MSKDATQDETSDFVCESEDTIEVETVSQDVDHKEEPASSESGDTEEKVNKGDEADADAEIKSTDSEDDSTGSNAADEGDKGKKPNRTQKRIDEIVRQREDEKRKSEALTLENESLKRENEGLKGKGKEPVESEFETYDEYLDALDKFDKQSDQEVKKESTTEKKDTESQDEVGLTSSQKTALAVTQERISAADKPDDFDAIALNPDLAITGEMLEALAECDDPAKVMYHLGQNKSLASEISGKTAVQQARAIAVLDLTVVSKPKKPTKLTSAPDVIEPVGGSDSLKKSHSEMSFSEFEAEDRARNSKRKSTW